MKLTDEEIELLISALGVHLCHIETGTGHLRAVDMPKATKLTRDRLRRVRAKNLSTEQMRLIIKLEDLKERVRRYHQDRAYVRCK